MGTTHIAIVDAGPLVRDVMLVGPKAVSPQTTVDDARGVFDSPRTKSLIVCDGTRYLGMITREDLEDVDGACPLGEVVEDTAPTLGPDDATARIHELVEQHGFTRIPVVSDDGELLGLVCFNSSHDAFCVA